MFVHWFIHWGKKHYHKKEGIAADFCPICRRISMVNVYQVRLQSHLYNIGYGLGDLVGRLCQCPTCKTQWPILPGTVQTSIDATNIVSPPPVEVLLRDTYPQFDLMNRERMQYEATILRDPFALEPHVRRMLLAEPFFVLDHFGQSNDSRANSWIKAVSGLGCIVSSLAFFGIFIAWISGRTLLAGGLGIVTVALGVWTLYLGKAGADDFVKKKLYPRLAACLAPLQPSTEELTEVIARVASNCAQQVKMDQFLPFLEAERERIKALG